MSMVFDPQRARSTLRELPEVQAQESLEPPELAKVYVPAQHAKALHLDASVVVGMRGAGKSWWTAVLASDRHREFVARQLTGGSLSRVIARVGYGLDETEANFPSSGTLKGLVREVSEPIDIWRTVVLWHALEVSGRPAPVVSSAWAERVRWTAQNRGAANKIITDCDQALSASNRVLLVLFDAFDRLATDWEAVRQLTTAALQLGLDLRSRRSIRLKFFIRPDLEEDAEIWRFPDSSKLRHAQVDLSWGSLDLYGLVFMSLGNSAGEFAKEFRAVSGKGAGSQWERRQDVYLPPTPLVRDREIQQEVVEGLADRYMGASPKRGATYTWIPLHLADAAGRISPRSYLLAFKAAAAHTAELRSSHPRALHYTGIQEGVIKASEVRVREIAEDYPWVEPLLEAAGGAVVPITAEELAGRWSSESLKKMRERAKRRLPPRRFTSFAFRGEGAEALIDDLVELGVLYRTKDGRLNIPDIFRVGFGIRRKGGVRPPR